MSQSFSVNLSIFDRCTAFLEFEDFWLPCIVNAEWSVDGVFYSSDLNPKPYSFCGAGVSKVCLKIELVTGEICVFCEEVEYDCIGCCTCDKFESSINLTQPDPCTMDFEIDPSFEECIHEIWWDIGGTLFFNTTDPPAVTFSGPGPHKVCVKTSIEPGQVCEVCKDYYLEGCDPDCNCDEVEAGVKIGKVVDCSVDFELDEALKECIKKLEWTIDGVFVSNAFNPPTYNFPGSGSYELCLTVVLANGKECKFCWKIDVECAPCDITCDDVKEAVEVIQVSNCDIRLDIKKEILDCLDKVEWTIDGVVYVPGSYPDLYSFTSDGVHEVCLIVTLPNGKECKWCWEFETGGCGDPCDLTCDEFFKGVSVTQTGHCEVQLDIKKEYQECIDAFEWRIDGVVYIPGPYPDTYTFISDGLHTVCLKVLLSNGETCYQCWEFYTEGCKDPCDISCDQLYDGISVKQISECDVQIDIKEDIRKCIKDIEWTVNGVVYTPGSYPDIISFTTDGVQEICVKIVLTNGKECKFCWKFEVKCGKPCDIDCEKLFSGIDVALVSDCEVVIDIKDFLKECIKEIKWEIDGVPFNPASYPASFTFTTDGLHTICVKVVLTNGLECDMCWTLRTHRCADPCQLTCEEVFSLIDVAQTGKCEITIDIKDKLKDCIKEIKWTIDGAVYIPGSYPDTYTFMSSGVHTVCVWVTLTSGVKCDFCWTFETYCPDPCDLDCEEVFAAIDVTQITKCQIQIDIKDFLKECIKEIKWEIDGVPYMPGSYPDIYTFGASGVHTVCVWITLKNGTTCDFCWTFETHCPKPCDYDCEEVYAAISVKQVDTCKIEIDIKDYLKDCIKEIKWVIDGVPYMPGSYPDCFEFTTDGVHTVCVWVTLTTGQTCDFCWTFETKTCGDPCDITCEEFFDGVDVTKVDDCTIVLDIKDYLKDCIKDHKWVIDGVSFTPTSYPYTYTFTTNGVHSVCLFVELNNGKQCEFCWKIKTDKCDDCDITCEEFFAGVGVTQNPDNECEITLEIKDYLIDCIEKSEWTINGVVYIPGSYPDIYQLIGNGTHTICLKVLLTNGLTCDMCWTFRADCTDPCPITCEDVHAGSAVTEVGNCEVKMELKEDLLDCIDKISWCVNGVEVFTVPNPPIYTFPAPGTYVVCLKVTLDDGTECEVCWEFTCEVICDVDCDDVEAALCPSYPDQCSVDLHLDESLEPCTESLGWYINGVLISTDRDPPVYTFPASGTYEICLKIKLTNGLECEICWFVIATCPCDCDDVLPGVRFDYNQSTCKLDFWLDGMYQPCVLGNNIVWTLNPPGIQFPHSFDPPQVSLTGSGTVEVCVDFTLITGEQCHECWDVDYDCLGGNANDNNATERDGENLNVLDTDDVRLYPNPNDGHFTVEMKSQTDAYMLITDVTGKILRAEVLRGDQGVVRKDIDISQYPSGIYNLTLRMGDRVVTRKLTISKN